MLFGLVTRAQENTCNQASHTWSDQQVLIGCDVRGNTFFSFLGFCFVYLFFYQITDRVLILYCSQMRKKILILKKLILNESYHEQVNCAEGLKYPKGKHCWEEEKQFRK